jgi:hypothetical protein
MTRHCLSFFAPTLDSATPPNGAQNFNSLADESELSVRRLARLLCVRPDTVMGWRKGRREVPEGIMRELRAYVAGTSDSDA